MQPDFSAVLCFWPGLRGGGVVCPHIWDFGKITNLPLSTDHNTICRKTAPPPPPPPPHLFMKFQNPAYRPTHLLPSTCPSLQPYATQI